MSLLECEPGTKQYHSTCLPEEIYYGGIIQNGVFFGGYFLGIGSFALIMSIVCFIIYKAGKSRERTLFKISIVSLAVLVISLIIYGIIE